LTGRFAGTLERPFVLSAVYLPAVFSGALLMFWAEMLIGKRVLPILGGAPMAFASLFEYPLVLVASPFVLPVWAGRRRDDVAVSIL